MKCCRYTALALLMGLLVVGLPTRAQGRYDWIRLGIHADPALNWYYFDSDKYKSAGMGFGISTGVDVDFFFAEHWAAQSGLWYDYRIGSFRYLVPGEVRLKYEPTSLPMLPDAVLRTDNHYLAVPVGLKMTAVEIGYVTIAAGVGVTGHFLLRQQVSTGNLKNMRADGMTPFAYLGYYFQAGIEYSLGGRSKIAAGIQYNGSATQVINPGIGQGRFHNLALHAGFVF